MKRPPLRILTVFALAWALPFHAPAQSAPAQPAPRKLALAAVRDLSADPRADYLGGILQGIVAYDLSRAGGIVLVDRASLDRVLAEQELQLSGIADDAGASARIGALLGADFLVSLDYVVLSGEILVTAKSVDVRSGRQVSFVERGSTENLAHRLAEALAEYYTGTKPRFADPAAERSILTLRDETPGSIALHSIMRHAEIYLDGEFAGYTTGDSEVPFVMDRLRPGRHTLSVHLGHGFGVVLLPQVEFADWKAEVDVQPGKRHVVRDGTRDFNSVLYSLQYVIDEDFSWTPGKAVKTWSARFQDRQGRPVSVSLAANPESSASGFLLKPVLTVDGRQETWTLAGKPGEYVEQVKEFGLVRVTLEIDMRYSGVDVDATVERTDVWQNMYDD